MTWIQLMLLSLRFITEALHTLWECQLISNGCPKLSVGKHQKKRWIRRHFACTVPLSLLHWDHLAIYCFILIHHTLSFCQKMWTPLQSVGSSLLKASVALQICKSRDSGIAILVLYRIAVLLHWRLTCFRLCSELRWPFNLATRPEVCS